MRWINAILAYGLLILACALTLYFLKLGGVEKQLGEATHKALAEKLENSPEFGDGFLKVEFTARKGHVTGIATTASAMQIAEDAVDTLARDGLPEGSKSAYEFTGLTHDWKRRPWFQLFTQGEVIALQGELAPSTLAILEGAIETATGRKPEAPVDPEAGTTEARVTGGPDIAIPKWEDSFGEAVEYFFRPGRLHEARIRVTAHQQLELNGTVQTNDLENELTKEVEKGFPSLVGNMNNMLRVERDSPAFDLKDENGIITIEGAVPSTNLRESLIEHLESQRAPGQPLEPAIQVLPDAASPDWLASKPTFFKRYLAEIKAPRIIIGKDIVVLGGTAPSKTVADELANLVQAQLSGHTVSSKLTFPDEANSP